jgi:cobalt-zinc-cadmium efflux system outer membrane protein
MMHPRTTVLLGGLVAASGAGCASDAERRAFDRWTRLDTAHFVDRPAAETRAGAMAVPQTAGDADVVVAVDAGPLTLDAMVAHALRHNPRVRAAFERWKAAIEEVPQARALPDPQVGIALMIDEVDAGGDYMGERYSIQQMFPWFGKLAAREGVALEAARAAERRYEAERLATAARVRQAYHEHRLSLRSIEIAGQNRGLLEQVEGLSRAMLRTGQASQPQVLRAQMELAELDAQLESLVDLARATAADLNAAVGRPAATRVTVDAAEAFPSPDIDPGALSRRLARGSAELAAMRADAAEQRASLVSTRRDRWPDVMLGVSYGRGTQDRLAMMDGGGADEVEVMASVTLPLWPSRYDAAERQSLARFAAATGDLVDRTLTLDAELTRAVYRFRDARRRQALYADTLLPSARQAQSAVLAAYRAGDPVAGSFTELIDAHRVLLEFELAEVRAAVEAQQALAEIELLIGGPIDDARPGMEPDDE